MDWFKKSQKTPIGPQSIVLVKTQHMLGLGNLLNDAQRSEETQLFSGGSCELKKHNRSD